MRSSVSSCPDSHTPYLSGCCRVPPPEFPGENGVCRDSASAIAIPHGEKSWSESYPPYPPQENGHMTPIPPSCSCNSVRMKEPLSWVMKQKNCHWCFLSDNYSRGDMIWVQRHCS